MSEDSKNKIINSICYTDLVYGRINKKLKLNLSNPDIETLVITVLKETPEHQFIKKGKNIYISNTSKNIRLTINSYTYRIITADIIKKG